MLTYFDIGKKTGWFEIGFDSVSIHPFFFVFILQVLPFLQFRRDINSGEKNGG